MFWWLFRLLRHRLDPRWLGAEAWRSGVRLTDCPYDRETEPHACRQWSQGWENEKNLAFYASSLGPAFGPGDWRGWAITLAVILILLTSLLTRTPG